MANQDAGRVNRVKSTMHSLAVGSAMQQAAEDYAEELRGAQRAGDAGPLHQRIDMASMLRDSELGQLHADRLASMQEEVEKRQRLQMRGHGDYQEVVETDFLEIVTKTERVVVHFFHRDFERCRVMDYHLQRLAATHFDTRFIKVSAPDSPFFTDKLRIRVLPSLLLFLHGVATDRITGFDQLGARDDFGTDMLEQRLIRANLVTPAATKDPEVEEQPVRTVRRSLATKTASDEDSDFD